MPKYLFPRPEDLLRPIHFSRVRLEGDPADPVSLPPSKQDVEKYLLPGFGKPDAVILCYTRLQMLDLPGIGPVVMMIGDTDDAEEARKYSMLVCELRI